MKQSSTNEASSRSFARFLQFSETPVIIALPCALGAAAFFQLSNPALLTFVVAIAALGVLFAGYESSRPALRQIMPCVVLGALAAAGRVVFALVPYVKPVSAICILSGVVFGRRSGFMVGALAAFVSNFFFGQGPWTPWQMYAWGLVGYLAGVFADAGLFGLLAPTDVSSSCQSSSQLPPSQKTSSFKLRRAMLYVYGFLSGLLYGFLLNTWTLVGFVQPITWESALMIYGAGLPFDCVHAVATVAFLVIIYEPWRRKLFRIKQKYQ